MLECTALGYFDRATMKANTELKDFDEGFASILQTHLKSEVSLNSLMGYILTRIEEGLSVEEFRLSLTV